MTKKQLIALFVCNFIIYAVGSGIVGLLPVYVTRLGGDSTVSGLYFAFAFFSLAVSTVIGGRLADRLQRRKWLLIAGGVLAAPVALVMSQATTVLQLVLLTGLLWFCGGISATMVTILAGLFSEAGERGRVFGILGFSINAAVFFSGLVSGQIVDRWGFPALLFMFSLMYLAVPLIGLLLEDKDVVQAEVGVVTVAPRGILSNRTFLFLFFASILAHLANSEVLLSRPLIMDSLRYDATAISSAPSVGALLVMPVPLLIGWLSDRLGRKPFIILCYLATTLSLVILASAVDLWHFWAASAFQAVLGVSLVVGSALITDRTPQEGLGSALSLFGATPWIGSVVGFGAGGAAIAAFQMTPTLMFGVALSLVAIGLLIPVSAGKAAVATSPSAS